MKKILTALTTLSLTGVSVTNVVACQNQKQDIHQIITQVLNSPLEWSGEWVLNPNDEEYQAGLYYLISDELISKKISYIILQKILAKMPNLYEQYPHFAIYAFVDFINQEKNYDFEENFFSLWNGKSVDFYFDFFYSLNSYENIEQISSNLKIFNYQFSRNSWYTEQGNINNFIDFFYHEYWHLSSKSRWKPRDQSSNQTLNKITLQQTGKIDVQKGLDMMVNELNTFRKFDAFSLNFGKTFSSLKKINFDLKKYNFEENFIDKFYSQPEVNWNLYKDKFRNFLLDKLIKSWKFPNFQDTWMSYVFDDLDLEIYFNPACIFTSDMIKNDENLKYFFGFDGRDRNSKLGAFIVDLNIYLKKDGFKSENPITESCVINPFWEKLS